ncbi:MAG: hypothetical protein DCC71_18625, partial [Proteobacteria bacterium]
APARAALAGPPAPGTCPVISQSFGPGREDAAGVPLREGQTLGVADLYALERLIPSEIWKARETFFHEGMRLEIGGCHRDYPPTAAYQKATEAHAGSARLDDDGNLHDYRAGRPFPEAAIDMSAPDAALRWAWNFEHRDRGAGPVGSFRIVDMPGRIGSVQTYTGSFFFVRTGHRADLVERAYKAESAGDKLWVAGGRFDEPFDARHLAWRQIRPDDAAEDYREPDDTFVYVPTMRKVRRAATAWVDGLYAPRYLVAGTEGAGGGVPFGANEFGPAGSIQPTAGLSAAATENLRRGFTGLAVRPNAYVWRLVGEREVLAPINGNALGYPENPDRNYGPSGLSVASDRWDVRWAVVVEGRARQIVDDVGYVRLWIDWQTGQPLYYMTDRKSRTPLDVGILVHRWSGDRSDYPDWPGVGRVAIFDPVAAVFVDAASGRGGWRRESYDLVSIPVEPKKLRKMTTVDALEHGR